LIAEALFFGRNFSVDFFMREKRRDFVMRQKPLDWHALLPIDDLIMDCSGRLT